MTVDVTEVLEKMRAARVALRDGSDLGVVADSPRALADVWPEAYGAFYGVAARFELDALQAERGALEDLGVHVVALPLLAVRDERSRPCDGGDRR